MTKVVLTPEEIFMGVQVGARRQVLSMRDGLQNRDGHIANWDDEIEGALAEVATAKHLGVWFDPSNGKYKAKDVAQYHVRQTKLENGRLIIRPTDPEGDYLLVIGSLGTYRIAGWIKSSLAKQSPFWVELDNGRPGCWMVPQGDLLDLPE